METTLVLPSEIQEIALKVPEKKQKEVQTVLNQVFNGTDEWEKKVDAIVIKDINDVMSIDLANTARLNAKKARLSGEKIFDAKRADVQLQMSDFKLEDALWLKSKQIMQLKFKHIEEKAKFKSDYVERYNKEQQELKVKDRLLKVSQYYPEIHEGDICLLTDDTFEIILANYKKVFEDKKAEEAKAEKERIESEKKEKERIAKIEAENKRLEKERIEAEKERLRLADIQAKKEAVQRTAMIKLKTIQEEKDRKSELERQRIAKIQADKLAKLKVEKQKLADEKEAERVKQVKAMQKIKEDAKAERLAPDKDKLLKWADDLFFYPVPELKQKESEVILAEVRILLGKIKNHIETKCKLL